MNHLRSSCLALLMLWVVSTNAQDRGQPPGSTVDGLVLNQLTQAPMAGATVTLAPDTGSTRAIETDEKGKFRFKEVTEGHYILSLTKTGFVRSRDSSGPTNLTVFPGQDIANLRLLLAPTASISGHIYDENGRAKSDSRVRAVQPKYDHGRAILSTCESTAGKTVITDENGAYRLFGLSPGSYYISAEPTTNCYVFPRYYPSATDPADAVPIDVVAGSEMGGIDIQLSKIQKYNVRFRTSVPPGQENDSSNIYQLVRRTRNGMEKTEYMIRQDGVPSIGENTRQIALPAGSYDLYLNLRMGVAVGRLSFIVIDRDLDAGTLTVQPGATIEGKITSANGELPLSTRVTGDGFRGLRVQLEPKDARDRTFAAPPGARSMPDGTFEFQATTRNYGTYGTAAAGRYQIEVVQLPPDYYIASAKYDNQNLENLEIVVSGESTGKLDITIASPGGIVEGIVRDSRDKPFGDSKVILIPAQNRRENLNLFKVGASDQFGNFSIHGVAPGVYGMLALEDVEAGAWQDPEFQKAFDERAVIVKVERGITSNTTLRVVSRSAR